MSCRLILIKKLLLLRTGTPMFGVGLGLGLRGFGEGVGCPGIGGARVSWPLMEVRVPSNPQSGTLQQGLRKSGIDHARGQGSSDVGQQRRNVTLGLLTAGVGFWGHHSALLGEGLCVLRASRRQGLVLSSGNQFFTNSATYQHEMIFGGFFKTSLKAVWN